MMRSSKVIVTGFAMCCVLGFGLLLSSAPALAASPPKVEQESASAKSTEATFETVVLAENEVTNYAFEYSTQATGEKLEGTIVKANGANPVEHSYAARVSVPTGAVLAPDTTYHYRAVAENAAHEKAEGKVESFTTVPIPHTDPVTAIGATTATLNGHLTLNPLNTTVTTQYYFDYNPSATECVNSLQSAPGEAGIGSGLVADSAEVTELQPNATYSVCLVTSNASFGSEVDPTTPLVQFTTLPAPPEVVASSESASGVTPSEATLNATVNPNNEKTTYFFEYSTSEAEVLAGKGTKLAGAPPAAELEGFGGQGVAVATGSVLETGQTYYYRVVAENATPPATDGTIERFTTQGKPLVASGEAQNITRTTATFSGTVDPVGSETSYRFVYIDQAGYEAALAGDAEEKADPYAQGESTAPVTVTELVVLNPFESILVPYTGDEARSTGPVLASAMLPGSTYHYALVAKNALGLTIGPDQTVTTSPGTPPIVSTGGASGLSQNAATLSGTVATNGLQTEYGFEIATEPGDYGPATGLGGFGGAATEAVSVTLGELQPGTTYYYRVTATNADGTSYGEAQTFTTPAFPTLLLTASSAPLLAYPNIAIPQEEASTGSQPTLEVVGHGGKGKTATLELSVPSPGTLVATGKGVSKASRKATEAGTLTVTLHLSKAGRALLAKHRGRKLKVSVKLVFTSTTGSRLRTSATALIG
jgi:hypothetical protein